MWADTPPRVQIPNSPPAQVVPVHKGKRSSNRTLFLYTSGDAQMHGKYDRRRVVKIKRMQARWAMAIMLAILMAAGFVGLLPHKHADEQTGYFVWMDQPFGSGDTLWQKAKKSGYTSCFAEDAMISLSDSEDGYLIRNLADEEALCVAVRDENAAPDEYTVYRYDTEGARIALFSFRAEDVFSFLGFQGQTVYFVRYMVDEALSPYMKYYHVIKSGDGREETLVSFENRFWKRPSINADAEILYTSRQGGEEKVFYLDGSLKSKEMTSGSDPVWYDEHTFLYVRDGEIHRFNLTAFADETVMTQDCQPIRIHLNPYAGGGIYLSRDRNAVVYATEKEEKWLFFILSGYFYKCWNVTDLRTGKATVIGKLQESYDNIMTF